VAEEVAQLLAGEARVERQRHAAAEQGAKVGNQERQLRRRTQGHALAGVHAPGPQQRGGVAGQVLQLAVRGRPAAGGQGGAGRLPCEGGAQFVEEVGSHRGFLRRSRTSSGRYFTGSVPWARTASW